MNYFSFKCGGKMENKWPYVLKFSKFVLEYLNFHHSLSGKVLYWVCTIFKKHLYKRKHMRWGKSSRIRANDEMKKLSQNTWKVLNSVFCSWKFVRKVWLIELWVEVLKEKMNFFELAMHRGTENKEYSYVELGDDLVLEEAVPSI